MREGVKNSDSVSRCSCQRSGESSRANKIVRPSCLNNSGRFTSSDEFLISSTKPGTLYGSLKVHKCLKNELPPFTPILSATDNPTYELAKFLVPILSDITQNEFTVKDSFAFVDELLTQGRDRCMVSLDVDALFTNIPLGETIDI